MLREPLHSTQFYCSYRPFNTNERTQGGGESKTRETSITDDNPQMPVEDPLATMTPAGGLKTDTALATAGGQSSFMPMSAPAGGGGGGNPMSAMDHFANLARDPSGTLSREFLGRFSGGVQTPSGSAGPQPATPQPSTPSSDADASAKAAQAAQEATSNALKQQTDQMQASMANSTQPAASSSL